MLETRSPKGMDIMPSDPEGEKRLASYSIVKETMEKIAGTANNPGEAKWFREAARAMLGNIETLAQSGKPAPLTPQMERLKESEFYILVAQELKKTDNTQALEFLRSSFKSEKPALEVAPPKSGEVPIEDLFADEESANGERMA